jgi:hypothetical protein
MTSFTAVPAAGTDQPAASTAKIKTASHTKFLTLPGLAPDADRRPRREFPVTDHARASIRIRPFGRAVCSFHRDLFEH